MSVSSSLKKSVQPLARYRKLNRLGKLLARAPEPDRSQLETQALREAHKEFISSVSHELRTPLTSLSLSVQLVSQILHSGKAEAMSPEKLKFLTETADRQIERLNHLMGLLLEASTIKAEYLELHPEEMDLNEVVESEIERFRSVPGQAELPLRLVSSGPVRGIWDRKRVEQALRKLLDNAALYGRNRPIEVCVRGSDEGACIDVRDQGIGIPEADQRRIFGLFERGVPGTHFCGLGIGLYVAQQIALAHQGEVRVASRPGEGSTFTLQLPAPALTLGQPSRSHCAA